MSNESHNFPALVKYRAFELPIDWDTIARDEGLSPNTLKEIENAWKNHAIIDNVGYIWLSVHGLRSILRLSKRDNKIHRLIYTFFVSKHDKRVIEGIEYIRGLQVGKLIDMNIQSRGTFKKRAYSKFAHRAYMTLVEHPYAELLRAKARENALYDRSQLKKIRIEKYGILYDELSGDRLKKPVHFSHIRSVALFPDLSNFFWNGLIVNANVHKEITKLNVNNEEMLYNACNALSWDFHWVDPYKLELNRIGYTPLI